MAQIIVRLKERELQRVPVTHVATRIGRDATNHVVIDNDGVSRHHATLRYESVEGVFVIQDEGSANGVVVRGRRTPDARIADGDEVQIGKFTLVLVAEGGPPVDALLPDEPPPPEAPRHVVRNPLPTTALKAARPKAPASRPSTPSIAPSPPESLPAPPATASVAPAAPPPAETVAQPPAPDDAPVEHHGQAHLLKQITWLLAVLIGLLGIVIGLLLRRR